ncbi:MAG: hypothetical protein ACRD4M_07420 [Candidatus Acidiferrales bacterium]
MKRNIAGSSWKLAVLCVLAFGIGAILPAHAQNTNPSSARSATAANSQSNAAITVYDLSREIVVQGNIQKIDTAGDRVPMGAHLLVETSTGLVDAHLGTLNAASLKLLGLYNGEAVSLTGITESENGNSVMLVRILNVAGRNFTLRNKNGLPLKSLVPRVASTDRTIAKGGR